MRLTSRWIPGAAVSAALLLVAVATSHAEPVAPGGTPIVTGGGHWLIPTGDTVGYSVSVVELPDGSIGGQGVSYRHGVDGNIGVNFDVVDIQPVGDELFVLSRITHTQNVPVEIGSWALLAIQDNGDGSGTPDKAISDTGNIPSFVPVEVIKQIVMLPPPDGPPGPDEWFPLAGGNFTIH